MSESEKSAPDAALLKKLEDAALERPGAAAEFFRAMLEADVFIPKKPSLALSDVVGSFDTLGYLTAKDEDREILPIFSNPEMLLAWAGRDVPVERRRFAVLLTVVKDELWLHLNPGQDFGKEFSPWEVGLLRQGPGAIPELAAESSDEVPEVEIDSGPDLYPELKSKLKTVFEVYEGVEEAFLVDVREAGATEFSPLIAVRQKGMTPEKVSTLTLEIEGLTGELLEASQKATILTDLDDPKSLGTGILRDAVPFYLKQQAYPAGGLKSKLFSLFRRGGEE